MKIQIFPPKKQQFLPADLIYPPYPLSHGNRIQEIKDGQEDLRGYDGIYTKNKTLTLGITSADCASIAFWNDHQFGLVHAGWRGLTEGIIEKMCQIFDPEFKAGKICADTEIYVGPMLRKFEIQKDHCYQKIFHRFGDAFFCIEKNRIFFDFYASIFSIIPQAQFDIRQTGKDKDLASWRKNQTSERNFLVISV